MGTNDRRALGYSANPSLGREWFAPMVAEEVTGALGTTTSGGLTGTRQLPGVQSSALPRPRPQPGGCGQPERRYNKGGAFGFPAALCGAQGATSGAKGAAARDWHPCCCAPHPSKAASPQFRRSARKCRPRLAEQDAEAAPAFPSSVVGMIANRSRKAASSARSKASTAT
jgi:hypothetical protein